MDESSNESPFSLLYNTVSTQDRQSYDNNNHDDTTLQLCVVV